MRTKTIRFLRYTGVIVLSSVLTLTTLAQAVTDQKIQTTTFDIPAQPLAKALVMFSQQSKVTIIAPTSVTKGLRSHAVLGDLLNTEALKTILGDTALEIREHADGSIVLVQMKKNNKVPAAEIQMDQTEVEVLETIVVTGTNIRGAHNPASPLVVIDRVDIDKAGIATAEQLTRILPQNLHAGENSAANLAGNNGRATVGSAGINLRGLGPTATLTLIDGNRIAPGAAGAQFTDLSLVPFAAVERVEVLTDGSSAVYGTDAVAGVVNFVLKDDYEGAQTSLRVGGASGGTAQEYQLNQTIGKVWGSGSILGTYGYYHRNELNAEDRSFSEDAADPSFLLPEQKRHSVYTKGRQEITKNIQLVGDINISTNDVENSKAFLSAPIVRFEQMEYIQYGGNLGLDFALNKDWRGELSGTYSQNELEQKTLQNAASFSSFDTESNAQVVDIKFDGPLFRIQGGKVKAAIGAHHRSESFTSISKGILFSTPIVIDLDRNVTAVFAELLLPIVGEKNSLRWLQSLDITTALRHERYSDFGTTTNHKVGMVVSPIDGLRLRGTFSTSFRAPTFFEIGATQAPQALPSSFFQPFPNGNPAPNIILLNGGNLELGPEESESFTIGIDFSPEAIDQLDLSITYFDIDFTDRVDSPIVGRAGSRDVFSTPGTIDPRFVSVNPSQNEINRLFASPFFQNFFGVTADSISTIVDNRSYNIGSTEVSGVDFSIRYTNPISRGELSFGMSGTYLSTFKSRTSQSAPAVDLLNTYSRPIDLRIRGDIGWTYNRLTTTLFVNYVGDYRTTINRDSASIDSWTTLDISFLYDVSTNFGGRVLLNDVQLIFNIQNLLDKDPPFADRNLNNGVFYDGQNANPLGRIFSIQVQKSF